jgi:hypothetical protein
MLRIVKLICHGTTTTNAQIGLFLLFWREYDHYPTFGLRPWACRMFSGPCSALAHAKRREERAGEKREIDARAKFSQRSCSTTVL